VLGPRKANSIAVIVACGVGIVAGDADWLTVNS
jgi:hypothetical protein